MLYFCNQYFESRQRLLRIRAFDSELLNFDGTASDSSIIMFWRRVSVGTLA